MAFVWISLHCMLQFKNSKNTHIYFQFLQFHTKNFTVSSFWNSATKILKKMVQTPWGEQNTKTQTSGKVKIIDGIDRVSVFDALAAFPAFWLINHSDDQFYWLSFEEKENFWFHLPNEKFNFRSDRKKCTNFHWKFPRLTRNLGQFLCFCDSM